MKNNESIYNRLFSKQNIYMAIYSVESYISNKELLNEEDKYELNRLKDKFDENNVTEWIERIRKRMHKIIDDDEYIQCKIFFKPKKYDDKKKSVIFRPLHVASLQEQMVLVTILNVLIYDFDCDGNISMSNLSRLLPHNFYGNRVAYESERLFKPWQEQYKQYTSKANEYYKKYNENGEYKWEIDLDLENFFPSINPIALYNYVIQQIPVIYSDDDRKMLYKIVEKLIFVKIEKLDEKDLEIYL